MKQSVNSHWILPGVCRDGVGTVEVDEVEAPDGDGLRDDLHREEARVVHVGGGRLARLLLPPPLLLIVMPFEAGNGKWVKFE